MLFRIKDIVMMREDRYHPALNFRMQYVVTGFEGEKVLLKYAAQDSIRYVIDPDLLRKHDPIAEKIKQMDTRYKMRKS